MVDNKKNSLDPPVGLVRTGSIVGYNPSNNTLQIQLVGGSGTKGGTQKPVSVPGTFPLIDSNGMFIGTLPAKNTPVVVSQGAGGQYYLTAYKPETATIIPDLKLGELLLFANDNSKMTINEDSNIEIGSDTNNIHIFAGSQKYPKGNFITINFENENHFNQAYREVGGLIKRDTNPNPQAASATGDTKLEDDSYDKNLTVIGLDPTDRKS